MSVISTAARHGLAALKGSRKSKGKTAAQLRNTHVDDQEAEIQDLIADLLHLADQQGFRTARILRCAKSNFEAEVDNARRGKLAGYYGAELDAIINS